MTEIGCDIAVVGAGTAGCVVAGRLAEAGADVVVLEAGPDYGARSSGRWPADLLDGGSLVTSHDWGYSSGALYPGREPIPFSRARVIGGCSSHNGCIAAIGCAEDYDAWAAVCADAGWSSAAVRPLIARALERLRVRRYTEDEIGPFHRACLDAAVAIGLPRADDLDDLDGGVGFGIEPVNVEAGVRVNAAFAYLDPVRSLERLRILDEVLCDRVVHGTSAVDVIGWRRGKEVRVHAAHAVLSAGAYGSPAILLRSGIGPARDLERLGIDVVLDLPGVGGNLHDHPMAELDFTGSPELSDALADASSRGFVPEGQIGKVKVGQPARLYLDSDTKKPLDAVVQRIDPQATFTPENTYFRDDRVKQVVGVKLLVKSGIGFAKPGMPADGEILVSGTTWPEVVRGK